MSSNSTSRALKCRECGKEYPLAAKYVCEFCFGPLEVAYDYAKIKKQVSRALIEKRVPTMWRYREFLPVDGEPVSIQEGFTPLIRARNLEKLLGLKKLYIKNDCANPTHSFKDRVVSVAATKALELGFDTLCCPSTGNLGNAVSAYGARAGMKTYVFIPSNLETGKVVASNVYQPNLYKVDGNYDEINRFCSEVAANYSTWAFVNINVRPYYAEGSKTLGFEVAEQLGWKAPDHVVAPMASGSLLTKIWKALKEFEKCGLIGEVKTRVSGAQAAGCSPIATAYLEGTDTFRPVKPDTIAKSLAIGNPADGYYALQVIKESGGAADKVTDDEIVEGIKLLASTEGIFAETAGGVTIATLKKLVESGKIKKNEVTVAYITGTGLKTQEALTGHLREAITIKPNLAAFEASRKSLAKV